MYYLLVLSTEEMAVVILVISQYRAEGKVIVEETLGKGSKKGGCNTQPSF
jgi:hypothetical protein